MGQFQASEPSHLAVSEACRENGRFHDIMRFWAILGLGRPLDSQPAIVSVHRIPFIEVTPKGSVATNLGGGLSSG